MILCVSIEREKLGLRSEEILVYIHINYMNLNTLPQFNIAIENGHRNSGFNH